MLAGGVGLMVMSIQQTVVAEWMLDIYACVYSIYKVGR